MEGTNDYAKNHFYVSLRFILLHIRLLLLPAVCWLFNQPISLHTLDRRVQKQLGINSHPTMFSIKAARNIFTTPYRLPLPALGHGIHTQSIIGSTYPAPNETSNLKAARGKAHRFPVRYPSRPYEAITHGKLRSDRRLRESCWKTFWALIENDEHPKAVAVQALFDEQKIREELLLHGVRSTYRRVDRPLLSPEDVEREKVERNKRKVLQFAKLNARYVEPVTLRPLFVRRDVWMATGRAWFTRTMFDNIHKVMSGAGWVTSSPWMEIICTTIRRQKKDERMVWVLWSVLARKYGVWGNESEAEWLADGEPAVVSEERVNGEIHHEKTGTEDEEWKDVAWPSSQARRELNKRMEQ